MTDWYCLPYKTALGLILIISRSSAVIKITAGKLIQLSIATFSDVSNGSSFLSINRLQQVIISGYQNVLRLSEYVTNCYDVSAHVRSQKKKEKFSILICYLYSIFKIKIHTTVNYRISIC